jgi:hypothetical protein
MLQVLRPESRKPGGFDIRIGSSSKSQAKIQTAARRESSEDSMKKAFLLIVVPALLAALGWTQTPAASDTDQTIKGCVGGSDGNYTVMEDSTGHIFKITGDSINFKQHLGHDVTLIGHRAVGVSSGAADSGFAVTGLNMISEHCAAAAAAPAAVGSTGAETIATPDAAAAAAASATIVPPPAETAVVPATDMASSATPVNPPAETIVTPDIAVIPPAEIAVTPAPDAASTAASSSTPWDTASIPVLKPADATRPHATSRKRSAIADAEAAGPAAPASASSETASTPAAAAATAAAPSETANTPDAPATAPAPPARHGALFLLISLGVLIIVIGTLVPFLSRWRKRRMLEGTAAPNLSFTREASSDEEKPEDRRKAA